jgi:hypothetical protein
MSHYKKAIQLYLAVPCVPFVVACAAMGALALVLSFTTRSSVVMVILPSPGRQAHYQTA